MTPSETNTGRGDVLELLVGYCLRQLVLDEGSRSRVLEGVQLHAYHLVRFADRPKEDAISTADEARRMAFDLIGKLPEEDGR